VREAAHPEAGTNGCYASSGTTGIPLGHSAAFCLTLLPLPEKEKKSFILLYLSAISLFFRKKRNSLLENHEDAEYRPSRRVD
jgi:hypothetical protein